MVFCWSVTQDIILWRITAEQALRKPESIHFFSNNILHCLTY
ncbi:MAG: hypothetical protein ACI8R9_000455 [Paraglaciecola sp.]|jgi:hypothetical protein